MHLWEIWSEGYAATGEFCPHYRVGEARGEDFIDACHNWFKEHPSTTYNPESNRDWGMRLFPTHDEAKQFLGGRAECC